MKRFYVIVVAAAAEAVAEAVAATVAHVVVVNAINSIDLCGKNGLTEQKLRDSWPMNVSDDRK